MSSKPSRREFLGRSASTAAAGWAGTTLYAADASARPGPNETVNLALIGCGNRGRQLIGEFKPLPGVRLVAVCDVEQRRLPQARQMAGGEKVLVYHDFRKLLDSKDIDAVIIASTDNWHSYHSIYACAAGKDVYVEKPLSNAITQGRAAVKAARKHDRIVQFGTQQRSWEHYHKAAEVIRSGRLGEISEVKVWDNVNVYPGPRPPADTNPPAGFDWDAWLGPAPKIAYDAHRHRNWLWFFDYGGAWEVRWTVHHYDVVNWLMGVKWPIAAVGCGGNLCFPESSIQWPDTFSGICEYGPGPVAKKGFLLQVTVRNGCRREQRCHGKIFCGTEASMILDRGGYTISPEARGRAKGVKEESFRGKGENHAAVFLENVRNHHKPFADVQEGHYATNPGHLMNISWRVGRKIRWDGQREQIIGDPEANALVHKEPRPPWKLDV